MLFHAQFVWNLYPIYEIILGHSHTPQESHDNDDIWISSFFIFTKEYSVMEYRWVGLAEGELSSTSKWMFEREGLGQQV